MRHLAIVSFSFAAGVFGAVYLLPEKLWILLAAALAVLGYSSQEVAAAMKGVDVETLSLEEIIRQSLKKMVKS